RLCALRSELAPCVPGRGRGGVSQLSGRGEAELTAFLPNIDHSETAGPAKAPVASGERETRGPSPLQTVSADQPRHGDVHRRPGIPCHVVRVWEGIGGFQRNTAVPSCVAFY